MDMFQAIGQRTDVPVVEADHQGLITHVNARFEEVFRWRREEILGKPLTVLIPPILRDAHHLGFSRFLTTGHPTLLNRPLKLKAVSKDGREFDAEHFIAARQCDGQWVFCASIQPLD